MQRMDALFEELDQLRLEEVAHPDFDSFAIFEFFLLRSAATNGSRTAQDLDCMADTAELPSLIPRFSPG